MVVVGNFQNKADLRKGRRAAFGRKGWISTGPGVTPFACEVVNISQSGAALILGSDQDKIPDAFVLMLTETGGVHRLCEVVWRDSTNVGVRFVKALPGKLRLG